MRPMVNSSTIQKVWHVLTSPQRKSAIVLLILMFVGMALEMLGIGLVVPAIALMVQGNFAARYPAIEPVLRWMGNPEPRVLLVGVMFSLTGVYFVKNLYLGFLAWRQARFSFGVQAVISQRLFSIYLHQPYTFHLQRNSAQLIHNVTGKVSDFIFNILIPVTNFLTEGLVLLGITALLFVVEPQGAAAVVLVIGGAAWAFQRNARRRVMRWGEAHQHHEALRIQCLQEGLGGAKDVKLLGREADFLARYELHNTMSSKTTQYQIVLQQLPRLWLETLAVMGMAILIFVMMSQGHSLSDIVPVLGLFAAAAFRLMPSVSRVLGAVQAMHYGRAAVNALYAELQFDTPVPQMQNDDGAVAVHEEVRLADVTYTYPGVHVPALAQITLSIKKGESVGFIGPSGSGKSTLVDIILGLLTPGAGQVIVDGQDIRGNLRAWQNQIGYVPQSIYLTDDTLRRNVAFGVPAERIDDEAVRRAIQSAQLEEFVNSQPEGLETVVGERGVRLSGGQRQRIGIARALYHDPDVLVLDEATSALDTATERGVMQAVTALHGNKTILIVAHRLSTVEQCDRLYRLERGIVVEEGEPSTMIARSN